MATDARCIRNKLRYSSGQIVELASAWASRFCVGCCAVDYNLFHRRRFSIVAYWKSYSYATLRVQWISEELAQAIRY
jgi:hypothetical protein